MACLSGAGGLCAGAGSRMVGYNDVGVFVMMVVWIWRRFRLRDNCGRIVAVAMLR